MQLKQRSGLFESDWGSTSPAKRGRLMYQLADLMQRDLQILQELESLDNGKPLTKAKYDVLGAINHFRYYSGWATKIEGLPHSCEFPGSSCVYPQGTFGCGGIDCALELPADDGRLEIGARTGLWQHMHPQACGADAAYGSISRETHRRSWVS